VSSKGYIFSRRTKGYLKTHISNGSLVFTISLEKGGKDRKQLRVDLIVAKAFLQDEKEYLLHKDGKPTNNKVDNLCWLSIEDYLEEKYGGKWKPITEDKEHYVSDQGQVWGRVRDNIITQRVISGYPSVTILTKFHHVHRLVAFAFCPNERKVPIVNHKDGNKNNSKAENLEWVTLSENAIHGRTLPKKERQKPREKPALESYRDLREIPEIPGCLIAPDGNVYNTETRRFYTLHLNNNGYYRVSCTGKMFYVHRLVALAFLPSPKIGQTQVNHKNKNRLDNRVENLEWCSASENTRHASETKPYRHLQKKVAKLDKDTKEVIEEYEGLMVASRTCEINSGSIVKCCQGIRPSAGGFDWVYI